MYAEQKSTISSNILVEVPSKKGLVYVVCDDTLAKEIENIDGVISISEPDPLYRVVIVDPRTNYMKAVGKIRELK